MDNFNRQLKRFDLPLPRENARLDVGQHFQFEPLPSMKNGSDGFIGYSFEKKVAVEFVKRTERFLLQSIIKRAQENGITDLYVLNEDFVMEAIREKLEREEKKNG